jgi:cobalt ABC transporter, permease protein CbiQ
MSDLRTDKLGGFKRMEHLAMQESALHDLSASVKIAATFVFIAVVVSFGAYDFSGLLPFLAYPVIAAAIAKIPWSLLLKRSALALPFVAFAGVANLIFDNTQIATPFGFFIPGGFVSFAVLLLKAFLTVSAALILAATTPITDIASGLKRFGLPCVLVLQFILTCRYLGVLIEEAQRILNAYMLRAPGRKIVRFGDWHKLAASLFLNSLDRAERIYAGMLCRGFNARHAFAPNAKESAREILLAVCFAFACVAFRFFNLSYFFGNLFYA